MSNTITKIRDNISLDITLDQNSHILSIDNIPENLKSSLKFLKFNDSDKPYIELEQILFNYNIFNIQIDILKFTLSKYFPNKKILLAPIYETIDDIDKTNITFIIGDLVYKDDTIILYDIFNYINTKDYNHLIYDLKIMKTILRIEELILEANYDLLTFKDELFSKCNIYYIKKPDLIRSGSIDDKIKYISINKNSLDEYINSCKDDNIYNSSLISYELIDFIIDFIY